MADITAANVVKKHYTVMGNLTFTIYKVTGDGAGVTIPTHCGRIISAWVSNQTQTAGYSPQISWATNIVTYATAPVNALIHYLHVVGTS